MAKGLLRAAALAAGIVALGAVAAPPRLAVADGADLGGIWPGLPISLPVDACPGEPCDDQLRTRDVPAWAVPSAGLGGGPVSHEQVSVSEAEGPPAHGTAAREAPSESRAMTDISAGRRPPADDDAGAAWTFAAAGLPALAAGVLRAVRRSGR